MSEYWALNEEGRLYIPNLTPESIPYDIYDRCASSWYLNSETGRIDADIIPNAVQSSSPFPMGVWYMQSNGKLHAGGIPDKIYGQSPYSQGVWYLRSIGQLHAGGIPYNIIKDSFLNCNNLKKVKIPNSMTSISKLAFENTILTKVKLPDNCTYYSTSFPSDCEVTGGQIIE